MALTPLPVDDGIPEEEVVVWVVCCLLRNRAVIPSGMRSEHLRSWMHSATRYNFPEPTQWEKVVGMIQAVFFEGHIADECT